MLRHAFAFAVAACISTSADAQSRKLQEDEIASLLSGNTAVGKWEGIPYRQYFGSDGTTIFAQHDARSARGEWRVDGEEYQSIWPGDTEWESWFVMEYLGDYYWVSRATPPTPFQVLEGQRLVE